MTYNLLHQLRLTFLLKAISSIAPFYYLPVIAQELGATYYGVFATIFAFSNWIYVFDIGIGNKLKNEISIHLANNENEKIKFELANAYAMFTVIAVAFVLVVVSILFFVEPQTIFSDSSLDSSTLRFLTLISSLIVCNNFILSCIYHVCYANHQAQLVMLAQCFGNVSFGFFTWFACEFFTPFIDAFIVGQGVLLLLSNAILTIYVIYKNAAFVPVFKNVTMKSSLNLVTKSYHFFILQICMLVIFMTDRLIVSSLLGAEHAARYDITYRLFSVLIIISTVISNIYWPAYTKSLQARNMIWIKKSINLQILIWAMLAMAGSVIALNAATITIIWVSPAYVVNEHIYWTFCLYFVVMLWNHIWATVSNAIDKTSFQVLMAVLAASLNLPLSYILTTKFNYSIDGVLIASVFCLLPYSIFGPFTVYRALRVVR